MTSALSDHCPSLIAMLLSLASAAETRPRPVEYVDGRCRHRRTRRMCATAGVSGLSLHRVGPGGPWGRAGPATVPKTARREAAGVTYGRYRAARWRVHEARSSSRPHQRGGDRAPTVCRQMYPQCVTKCIHLSVSVSSNALWRGPQCVTKCAIRATPTSLRNGTSGQEQCREGLPSTGHQYADNKGDALIGERPYDHHRHMHGLPRISFRRSLRQIEVSRPARMIDMRSPPERIATVSNDVPAVPWHAARQRYGPHARSSLTRASIPWTTPARSSWQFPSLDLVQALSFAAAEAVSSDLADLIVSATS